jgi:hypothetical protein
MSLLRVAPPAVLLLFLTTASAPATPPVSSSAPRPFTSLSERERIDLPEATMVTVGGHAVTLGELRIAHYRRVSTFASAASAGAAALQAVEGSPLTSTLPPDGKTNPVPGTPLIEPPSEYADNALDKRTFCNAAHAAVCLYYPAATTLYGNGSHVNDVDPYITDPAICGSQGGIVFETSCRYDYDNSYHVQFNPGKGFVYKAACDSRYWTITVIDKHGAILVDSKRPPGMPFTTGDRPPFCLIRVWFTQ